jgi:hypothetical protein
MKVASKAELVFTKDWVFILKIAKNEDGHDKYLCRTKDLREVWFYDFELKPL